MAMLLRRFVVLLWRAVTQFAIPQKAWIVC